MSTILVVDDNAICREPIAEALRGNGYDVICAANGAQALSLLVKDRPDLVLLDVNMPELDGLAVLRTMRRNPELADISVIMLTEKAEREHVTAAVEHRVQGYLLKSQFSLDELFACVGACLKETIAGYAPRQQATAYTKYGQWRQKIEQPPTSSATSRSARPSMPRGRATSESAAPAPLCELDLASVKSLDDLSPIITKTQLFKLVNEGLELRPLGPTVQNVIAVTGSSGCCADDVAKAVTHDQALSIRILKLANSSAFSRGRSVNSVKEAVSRIGVQEVRSMVMALGVLQQYEGGAGEHVDPRMFWEHSIACGLIASAIARQRGDSNVDDSFLWGMVHDVGRLILLDHVSDPYGHVWNAADQLGVPLEAVEAKLMMLDHCDILEQALEHWNFPREFIAPAVNHHHSIRTIERLGPQHCEAAATVALANRLAHALLLGSSGNEVIYPLDELVYQLKLKPETIAQLTETIPNETRDLKVTMIARSDDESWPNFALETKERLGSDIRPLCVSAEPDVDAYRIFCERIASPSGDKAPNLGVIYLRDANEFSQLTAKYDAANGSQDAANNPVVLIVAKGELDPDHPWLATRRHTTLTTPVRIAQLVATIQQVLS